MASGIERLTNPIYTNVVKKLNVLWSLPIILSSLLSYYFKIVNLYSDYQSVIYYANVYDFICSSIFSQNFDQMTTLAVLLSQGKTLHTTNIALILKKTYEMLIETCSLCTQTDPLSLCERMQGLNREETSIVDIIVYIFLLRLTPWRKNAPYESLCL